MKKIVLLLSAITLSIASFAQTVPGADMESWRTNMSGTASPATVMAPYGWFGGDSLVIALGQTYGSLLMIPPSHWHRQLFREDTIIHGGAHASKLVTIKQDTLGLFPGILSNAQANVNISLSGGTPSLGGITYTGGTGTALKITTASAWVQYTAGLDSVGGTSIDSGLLTVQAVSNYMGYDSVVGTGTVKIGPSSSYHQITATVNYVSPGMYVDTFRITFTSSSGAHTALNSTLYVDDVTVTGVPQESVAHVNVNNKPVSVYPNPVNGILHLLSTQNDEVTFALFTVTGQKVATSTFATTANIDLSNSPEGIYFYTITNKVGEITQRGNVNVIR